MPTTECSKYSHYHKICWFSLYLALKSLRWPYLPVINFHSPNILVVFSPKEDKRSIENIHQHIEPFMTLHPHWKSHAGCAVRSTFNCQLHHDRIPQFCSKLNYACFQPAKSQTYKWETTRRKSGSWKIIINAKMKLVLTYLWAVSLGNISYTWQYIYIYIHNTKNMLILYLSIVNIMPFLIQAIWKT